MSAMVHSTSKLGLPTNAALETRLLATDMAAVLLSWDARAEREALEDGATIEEDRNSGEQKDSQSESGNGGSSAVQDTKQQGNGGAASARATARGGALTPDAIVPAKLGDHDRLHPGSDELLVNFLLRMAFVSSGSEGRERDEAGYRRLHAHCLSVLRDAAAFRPPVALKLHYFEKVLSGSLAAQTQTAGSSGHPSSVPEAPPVLVTGLEIAHVFLSTQPANFVACAANQLSMMLEPALGSRTSKVPATLLAKCISLLVSRYHSSESAPLEVDGAQQLVQRLLTRTSEVINKFLAAVADPSQTLVPELLAYACNCLLVMKAAIEVGIVGVFVVIGSMVASHRSV